MQSKNNQRGSKYASNSPDLELTEHHYQNQQTRPHSNFQNQQRSSQNNQMKQGQSAGARVHYKITRNPSMTSSILSESEKKTCSFFVIILAVVLQFLAIIIICVTFIFPFWTWLKFYFPAGTLSNSGNITVTNTDARISLIAKNEINSLFPNIQNLDLIQFDMGLWDLKTYRILSILGTDNPTVVASNVPTMRWTTGDMTSNTFVYMLITLIGVNSSTIFGVQIIEILHLIFTVLTLAATSVTLCLCTNRRASLAWYLVCFLMNLVSMFLGLAVIIIIIAFQTQTLEDITPSTLVTVKGYGFCFWLSVAIQCLLVGSACLILTYIIIASVAWYEKNKDAARNKKQHKIPRLKVDSKSKENDQPINAFSNLQQIDPHNPNTAYVFYTGHGNYHKHPNGVVGSHEQNGEFYQPPPEHMVNYQLMMQSRKNVKGNEHPYSNVLVEQINHAYNGPT